jgi:hypothetical protein
VVLEVAETQAQTTQLGHPVLLILAVAVVVVAIALAEHD